MKPGERRECKACGKDIVGARTKDGKVAPITFYNQGQGNVLLFKSVDNVMRPVLECRTFAGKVLEKLREEGVPLRVNHFADCPRAEEFR